ncbi:MAG: Glycosyl transferase [Candidatus Berkelbacteria bacterium Gr01-1014_85]|uniref:Glycosyl transferase n=1 Tax=Candidatus Berkelbacteria bacterium Gr01-1014_85 TaxID=2017150 RepID=A0A554JC21_9BACT|nr:MAG: Glycosyl transferase [Candidatus Berkelbacteria bacterium Gr01-1014_85]
MTMLNAPLVSVIIPTFNAESHLDSCLQALAAQDYPSALLELIVVDDGSTDQTLTIAKRFGAKVLKSGHRHIERSKSIGLAAATGELILLIDSDITLIGEDWLSRAVRIMQTNPDIAGLQTVYWAYRKSDSLYNRYCELTGVNDPFIYQLGRRGILGPHEKSWLQPELIVQTEPDYWLAKFNPAKLPTLGSQGYLTRRQLLLDNTSWQPYFFHLDQAEELVEAGHDKFALYRRPVHHDYVNSLVGFYRKLARNLILFLRYQKLRRYTYGLNRFEFWWTTLLMVSLVYPIGQAWQGYRRQPDLAWWLHPWFCLTVPILYTFIVIGWRLGLWPKSPKLSP